MHGAVNDDLMDRTASRDSVKNLQLLLRCGAKLPHTILHTAVRYGYKDNVQFLLENNADVDALQNGFSPLYVAIMKEQEDIVSLLLKHGAAVHTRQQEWENAFHLARHKDPKILEILLEKYPNYTGYRLPDKNCKCEQEWECYCSISSEQRK